MATTPINLIKGDSIGDETDYRDSLPVNMTAVDKPIFGSQGYMIQYPGLTKFGDGIGIDRGGIWNERLTRHLRVSGGRFIEVSQYGAVNDLGPITGNDTASLPYSFNTQAIVAGGNYYLYDPVNGLRQVTDPDVGNPIDCVWIDGFYCFTDGEFLYHTLASDESAIAPLDFAVSEFSPDPCLGCGKTQDNKWIAFNRYTTEYFRNDASADFSFVRVAQRALSIGIVGTHAKTEASGSWYILGGRKEQAVSVHVLGVGSSVKVATREVDKVIGKYTETELFDSVVESYDEDGYTFVKIHLPAEVLIFNQTIAETAGKQNAWSIIKSDVTGEAPYRGIHNIFEARLGKWVCGDKLGGNIGIIDNTVATQYGDVVEWILFTPFYYMDCQSIDEIEIETIPGHTGSSDAQVFMSLSYDGVTYGKEWMELYGSPNDYNKRFIFRRLGHVRDWVGIKLRGATSSRMAFGAGAIDHG